MLIGATPAGKKELIGFTDGARESAQDWRELLLDLKDRGLTISPKIAVADGALGFWKAIGEVWPTCVEQRCWVHKTANVLNKLQARSDASLPMTRLQSSDCARVANSVGAPRRPRQRFSHRTR